jgi:hypothetical protein
MRSWLPCGLRSSAGPHLALETVATLPKLLLINMLLLHCCAWQVLAWVLSLAKGFQQETPTLVQALLE